MPSNPTTVSCPTCSRPVPFDHASPWRPFCCERCRLIDWGEWVSEEKRIPADPVGMEDETALSFGNPTTL